MTMGGANQKKRRAVIGLKDYRQKSELKVGGSLPSYSTEERRKSIPLHRDSRDGPREGILIQSLP